MTALRLVEGVRLFLDSVPYRIAGVDPANSELTLDGPDGTQVRDLAEVLTHPGLVVAGRDGEPAAVAPEVTRLTEAPKAALTKAERRLAHVLEVETGWQAGKPAPGVTPDPRYDPVLVPNVMDRRRTKAEELSAPIVDPVLRMSYRTLERAASAWRKSQPGALVDGRSTPSVRGTRIADEILDAIERVVEERVDDTSLQTYAGLALLVRARVRRDHKDDPELIKDLLKVHDRSIVRAAKLLYTESELTRGKAKNRRTKLAALTKPEPRIRCTHPGHIVMGDVKDLDVFVTNTEVDGAAVRARLILWMDVYSASIVDARVVVGSEKSVDICQSIRSIGMPKLMEPGWDPKLRWPFVGVPAHVVDTLAGGMVAGMPFVQTVNLVVDNGRTYRAFANVSAAKALGTDVVPAHRMSPTEKARVERLFRSLDTLLCQFLQGYCGPDTAERGLDPEGRARYTPEQLEAIIREWIVGIWQWRPIDLANRPPWALGKNLCPNQLYNAGIVQTGLALRAITPQEYAALLPAVTVKLHRGGFRIGKQLYDLDPDTLRGADGEMVDPLAPWRGADAVTLKRIGSRHTVHFDDRDLRHAWWKNPLTGVFTRLTWRGAFGLADFPAFNDRDAAALAEVMAERRLDPLDGPALAEALLTLLDKHDKNWDVATPGKRDQRAAARRAQQAKSAARDRGDAPAPSPADADGDLAGQAPEPQPRRSNQELVTQVRRRARHDAGVVPGTSAKPLGSSAGGLMADLAGLTFGNPDPTDTDPTDQEN